MGYVACLGQIPEETAHVLQNLVSANGLSKAYENIRSHSIVLQFPSVRTVHYDTKSTSLQSIQPC